MPHVLESTPRYHDRSRPTVVAALDGTPASRHVAAWARAVAPLDNSRVLLLNVVSTEGDMLDGAERGEKLIAEALDGLGEAAGDATSMLAVGDPAEEIVEVAEGRGAGLVILGARPPGTTRRLFLGSVGDAVRNRTHANLLIARTGPPPPGILVGVDGTPTGRGAAKAGAAWSALWNVPTTFLHVATPTPGRTVPPARDLAGEVFTGIPDRAPSIEREILEGDPSDVLLEVAFTRRHGLVVVGFPKPDAPSTGVAHRVARNAAASVLLVREASA